MSDGIAARTATVTGMVSAPVELSREIFAKPVSIACGAWARLAWPTGRLGLLGLGLLGLLRLGVGAELIAPHRGQNIEPCCWNWGTVSTTSAVPSSRAMAGALGAIDGVAPASARGALVPGGGLGTVVAARRPGRDAVHLALLDGVGELVGEQFPARRGVRREPVPAEHDVLADRVRARAELGGRRVRGLVGVDAHGAEVGQETRLQFGPHTRAERLAGVAEHPAHRRVDVPAHAGQPVEVRGHCGPRAGKTRSDVTAAPKAAPTARPVDGPPAPAAGRLTAVPTRATDLARPAAGRGPLSSRARTIRSSRVTAATKSSREPPPRSSATSLPMRSSILMPAPSSRVRSRSRIGSWSLANSSLTALSTLTMSRSRPRAAARNAAFMATLRIMPPVTGSSASRSRSRPAAPGTGAGNASAQIARRAAVSGNGNSTMNRSRRRNAVSSAEPHVRRQDGQPVVGLHALQQVVDLHVGEPVVRLPDLGALAEQGVGLVEEQQRSRWLRPRRTAAAGSSRSPRCTC